MATKLWLFLRHCAVTLAGTSRAEIEWRFMLAVIESAQDLSSRLDLTSLLIAIVSRARNLEIGRAHV